MLLVLRALFGGEMGMKKSIFNGKRGHFTLDTVIISILSAAVAYFIVEKVIVRYRTTHEPKNPLRVRK